MTVVVLEIDVDSATTHAWFQYAGYHIRDAREPLREVFDEVLLPGVEAQFDTEGESAGTPWEQLTEDYEARKIAKYGFMPILEASGKGKRDIIGTPPRITKMYLRWSPKSDYMHWHQSGGYVPGRPPQRPWLVITAEDELQIQGIFESWLDELRGGNTRRGAPDAGFLGAVPDITTLGF